MFLVARVSKPSSDEEDLHIDDISQASPDFENDFAIIEDPQRAISN